MRVCPTVLGFGLKFSCAVDLNCINLLIDLEPRIRLRGQVKEPERGWRKEETRPRRKEKTKSFVIVSAMRLHMYLGVISNLNHPQFVNIQIPLLVG